MSVKSEVTNDYMKHLKTLHGYKKTEPGVRALMTGDGLPNSIGEAIRETLVANGGFARSLEGDVRDPYTFGSFAMKDFNTLIMCHGVSHLDWFEDAPIDKIKEIVDVNVLGTCFATQAFVHATLYKPYRKTIIMIGSMAHKAVLNGSVVYCASKAAVAHLARCLAWELAPKGYDVFCIHPSNTYGTPMSEQTIAGLERYRHLSRDSAEAYWNDSAIRSHSLTTGEISELVLYLCSGNAQYLAGAQLELAGGQR
jgi:NAD(P)-dependent dehydrogenase (short-subunit alcohol dehydrogenase family)